MEQNFLEIQGKSNTCKIFNLYVEEEAISQIYKMLASEAMLGSKIRIMSDVHGGAGCVIGFTATKTDKIIPNLIGVDVGCSVSSWNLGRISINFEEFDKDLRRRTPSGHHVRNRMSEDLEVIYNTLRKDYTSFSKFKDSIIDTAKTTAQKEEYVLLSIGSLGGGNHFIELDKSNTGDIWLTIHSGSRNFGLKVAQWHQKKAINKLGKKEGLEWLEGEDAELYYKHMKVAQEFAKYNRWVMGYGLIKYFFKQDPFYIDYIESVHNYINFEDGIIRKGAISAHKDQKVIIPWNMRDGIIIGVGKGNEDWNYSAPHGAGRTMSRGEAKRTLNLNEFKDTMKEVWSSSISQGTLDEAPMAYKDPEMIKGYIRDTVDILYTLKPIYNFKASE